MFNNPVIGRSGCFFDKITFVDQDSGRVGFTPSDPGVCDLSLDANRTLTGTMNVADYASGLAFMHFTSRINSYITIRGSSPVNLLPGVTVNPVPDPLIPSSFVLNPVQPSLISFDIDWRTNTLLLHFDALMDLQSVNPAEMFMLTNGSSSVGITISTTGPRYITTLCVPLSETDQDAIEGSSICESVSSCFCHFTTNFITDYNANLVAAIPAGQPLQVFYVAVDVL